MILSNIHTHTLFSDGKHSIEQNVESAISKGFSLIGFSDHSYLAFDNSYTMKTDSYDDYIKAVEEAKRKYKGKIEIRLGIEIDVDSTVERTPYDYIIGATHHVFAAGSYYTIDESVKIQQDCVNAGFNGDVFEMCRAYYENVCKAARLQPDVLAHFDLVTKFGLIDTFEPKYRKTALEAIDEVLNTDVLIEINTGAISRGYRNLPYPESFILNHIRQRNGRIIIGSDSHNLNNLDFAFSTAIEQLKKSGINSVWQLLPEGFTETQI